LSGPLVSALLPDEVEETVAEVLVEFPETIADENGRRFLARACGTESNGMWEGWIEFEPTDGGATLRTARETTQPNRNDVRYWATGLTPVYLEGALHRAQHPLTIRVPPAPRPPAFDEPAPAPLAAPATDAVLNPFSVYQKGEALLRRQLSALSAWHLANIARAYGLVQDGRDADRMSAATLTEIIVDAARRRAAEPIVD
jgi:hypothetical protein